MKSRFIELQIIFILLFYLVVYQICYEQYLPVRQQRLFYNEVPLAGIISE